LNLAQCPVPDDKYKDKQLQRCWNKWGYNQLEMLRPSLIVAQGKQVYGFLTQNGLPSEIQLVEGVHHADRRNSTVKDRLLENVHRQIEKRKEVFNRLNE